MSDENPKPSELAVEKLLQRINSEERIPAVLKTQLCEAIETGDPKRIAEIRSLLANWADSRED